MKKARPGYRAINQIRRNKDFTLEEWRTLFDKKFNRAVNDLYKNCKAPITEDDIEDIRQILEYSFIKFYNDFMEYNDKYEFPPSGGAFYNRTKWKILIYFMLIRPNTKTFVYSNEHDTVVERRKQFHYRTFEEEREKRIQEEKECNLCEYLEDFIGIAIDDEFDQVFALWWSGMTYEQMSVGLKLMNGRGVHIQTIKNRMNKVFNEIEDKYGVTRKMMRDARNECLKINRLRCEIKD